MAHWSAPVNRATGVPIFGSDRSAVQWCRLGSFQVEHGSGMRTGTLVKDERAVRAGWPSGVFAGIGARGSAMTERSRGGRVARPDMVEMPSRHPRFRERTRCSRRERNGVPALPHATAEGMFR